MLVIVCWSIFGLALGQVQIPHGHDLKQQVDSKFGALDINPTDGIIDEAEWDDRFELDDTNKDSCISYAEFAKDYISAGVSEEVPKTMFHHYDHDSDKCLRIDDMQAEFHLIDHNGDNRVVVHEWDQYFSHLITALFGHSHGHNGHTG